MAEEIQTADEGGTPLDEVAWRSRLAATFRITAEISSLFLLVGFILSAVINTFVFSYWGFEFLQIAGPSDVLMSGMRIALDALIALVISSITVLPVYLTFKIIVDWLINRNFVPTKYWRAFESSLSVIFLAYIVLAGFVASYLFATSFFEKLLVAAGIVTVPWGCGCIYGIIHDRESPTRLNGYIFGTLISIVVLTTATARLVADRAIYGFETFAAVVRPMPAACGKRSASLLWSGEHYIIVRCGTDLSSPTIAIRFTGELQLIPIERAAQQLFPQPRLSRPAAPPSPSSHSPSERRSAEHRWRAAF